MNTATKEARKEAQEKEILALRDKGWTQQRIANELGVNRITVMRALQRLQKSATAGVILSGGIQKTINGEIDVVAQLGTINEYCMGVLNGAANDPDQKMEAVKEIRSQLKLHVDIYERVYAAKNVQMFQQGVMQALENTDPKLRQEAVRRINKLREMAGVTLLPPEN